MGKDDSGFVKILDEVPYIYKNDFMYLSDDLDGVTFKIKKLKLDEGADFSDLLSKKASLLADADEISDRKELYSDKIYL